MWLGVVMFLIVIVCVFALTWLKAQNLTFDKTAHLEQFRSLDAPEPRAGPKQVRHKAKVPPAKIRRKPTPRAVENDPANRN